MATEIPFLESQRPAYATAIAESPLIRKIVAENPGPFTYWGTGTFIVGRGKVAVIDPGPPRTDHVEAILGELANEEVAHILVTHTHLDHSPGARLLARTTGAPVLAFGPHGSGRTAGLEGDEVEAGADREFRPDRKLSDGERVEGPGWTIEALHTPGHTSNHLCFALLEENALFSGDHVMGWSTTVISPPDGDMALYLENLERIKSRGFATIYPTHGPPIKRPDSFLEALIAHRYRREREILEAIDAGGATLEQIVPRVYADLPKALHQAAARSVLSHLVWLVERGEVGADPAPLIDARFRRK